MALQEINAIRTKRGTYVVKRNDLIQKTSYMLTTPQQKMLLFMISHIKPNDKPDTEYVFKIKDFLEISGQDTGGSQYALFLANLLKIKNSSTYVFGTKDGHRVSTTIGWIQDPFIDHDTGEVHIKFDEKIHPYLFELSEQYTKYRLKNILAFKSKYAIRLYELLESYGGMDQNAKHETEVNIKVARLREMMQTSDEQQKKESIYPRYCDFKFNVIQKSVEEINLYNEYMNVRYEENKKGRQVDSITFFFSAKDFHGKDQIEAKENISKRIDKYLG